MNDRVSKKRFISIRSRLFLQVGAIILIAVTALLALNRWYLPNIYILNKQRNMKSVAEQIDKLDYKSETYFSQISAFEKENDITIDIYFSDGTPLYYGDSVTGITGGKVEIVKKTDNTDGSFFEIQQNEKSGTQFIVFGRSLSFGGEIELYSKKSTIDSYADTASGLMVYTSIFALLGALVVIYIYSRRFTRPLIEMSRVTGNMANMDFTNKCTVDKNDEIGRLSESINHLSDSLNKTLGDLNEKNKKLQNDIEKEQNLDRIRKDFISNVSHELKTPISIIQGYSEGAKLMVQSGDKDGAAKYCDVITAETEKMNDLVLQLLELSMYESGNVILNESRIDLYSAVSDYADENKLMFAERGITFINDVPKDYFGIGDSIKIQMIINNYISNACSHADAQKLIKVTAGISPQSSESYRIYVFNTGKEIAEEDIDKVWISFYRADKSHSRSEGRFGLGLSIVSAIEKLHNQSYGVENKDGGVEFWFDIKRA